MWLSNENKVTKTDTPTQVLISKEINIMQANIVQFFAEGSSRETDHYILTMSSARQTEKKTQNVQNNLKL